MMATRMKFYTILLLTFFSQQTIAADNTALSPVIGFLQITTALAFVLLLMFGAAWLLKRVGPVASGNKIPLKIVGGINVGNKERVMVVEIDDQWMILGVTANSISNLGNITKRDIPSSLNSPSAGIFQDWLKRTIEKRNAAPNEIK